MAAEDANLRNRRFGTLGDLAARVRNYASRGRESANYGGAILRGLTALEWEEGAQHPAHWRFVTLYYIGLKLALAYPHVFVSYFIQTNHRPPGGREGWVLPTEGSTKHGP